MIKFFSVQINFSFTKNINRKMTEETRKYINEEVSVMLSKIEKEIRVSPTNLKVNIIND